MVEKKYVVTAYLLLAAVYIAGLFVPLMDNDAGEYALLALNMAQKNDFINIVRKGHDYLDKPHLLFWLMHYVNHFFHFFPNQTRLPGKQ